MPTTLRLAALACLTAGSLSAAESALRFVDLRAQGGLTLNDGETANLTLMAGDIGNKDKHIVSLDADMGIVLGLRGQVSQVTFKRNDGLGDLDMKLGGGTFLGGLGFYLGTNSHAELVVGYARGLGSTTGSNPWDDDDTKFTQYVGELGWYYTWSTNIQVGVTVGYSLLKVKYNDPLIGTIKGEADGFDASIALGYRF
ncbi:MAG: hypothetical protein H0W78_16465 [Planctomycetes bacterium]|jgi:hypothetical protein|nr:hypothetical protein [Planctomycetota bacterium]